MGFRINTNIAAMNAHTNSTMNNRNLDNSLGKLSSGLRINTAADDASGLAIANSLRAQASSLGQAVANGNDAIGLIQTADGALSEYSNILDTIKTKSVQAASDTQNTASRLAIQKDIDKLMEELNIIATTTSFNGQKLLSGTFVNKEFQMGANANESVGVNIASAQTNQIGQTSRADLNLASDQGGNVQLTLKSATSGESITLKNVDIQSNNEYANGMGALADEVNRYSGQTGITAKAIVSSTAGSAVSEGSTGSDFAINGVNIGAVNVAANDNDGTLLNAINSKTSQTGVTATMESDGKLTLQSDGRALEVTGGNGVIGGTGKEMSTVGYLEMVQAGSSEFQVVGIGTGAVTNDFTTTAATTTAKDSTLAAGSTMIASTVLKAGSVTGGEVKASASVVTVMDSEIKTGSVLFTGTIMKAGTEIGGTFTTSIANNAMLQDSLVTAGSTLAASSVLGQGTIIQQDFTDGTTSFTAGQVLAASFELTAGLTLTSDMTLKYDATAALNSQISDTSTLQAGTVLGASSVQGDTLGGFKVNEDMILKTGSTILASSTLNAGSTIGGDLTIGADSVTFLDTQLKAGSTLDIGSIFKAGSTIGGSVTTGITATNFTEDMLIKAGSELDDDTIFAAGTQINQDMTIAGISYSAGDVLEQDRTLGVRVTLSEDMVMKGSQATVLGDTSILATNTENAGTVGLSNEEFTNLSDIDVTTLEGAMKAIDTVSAAITNLDSIRSELGSSQNQVVSTINNISVTQVNVKAAESNLRDVDFAQESANFSKYNILAQSGSYAMSQANAVQQNVMRLLQ